MLPAVGSVFSSPRGNEEQFLDLLHADGFRLEHIASHGQPSPPGFWYDQPADEWVVLLRGSAMLRFDSGGVLELKAGDFLTIPAQSRHRVEAVSFDAIWLALHFKT